MLLYICSRFFLLDNCPVHILTRDALVFNDFQEWISKHFSHLAHSNSFDSNNI